MKVSEFEVKRGQFRIGDLDAGRVLASIQFGANLQACLGGCVGDQIDDDLMTQ